MSRAGYDVTVTRPVEQMFVPAIARIVPGRLTPGEQIDQLVKLEQMKAHLEFQQLKILAVMHDDDPSEQHCVIEEVRCALRLSAIAARERVDLARVIARSLPKTATALQAGLITLRHAQVMADAAARLPTPAHHRELESHLLQRAPEQTPADLQRCANRAVLRLDPDGAERRHTRATEQRRLQRYPIEDGMAELRLIAPAPQIAAAWTRLDACARRLGAEDPRTLDQRRADLLLDTLLSRTTPAPTPGATPGDESGSAGTSAPLPTQQGLAPRIEVVVSLSTLLGLDDQPADLAGYGPITAEAARDLAGSTDATWRRLVTDPLTGSLLDYGRTTYRPPADLRDFVLARDVVCAYPGCNSPARTGEIDHIIAFDGDEHGVLGETNAANTAPLCVRHHGLKTRRLWSYRRNPDGTYRWTSRRTGRTYTSHQTHRWNRPPSPPDRPPDANPSP